MVEDAESRTAGNDLSFTIDVMWQKPIIQDVDLAVVDAEDLEDIQNKQQKIDRVIKLIKENNLDKDPEFMQEVMEAFDGILEIEK